jgi:CRISPR-associated protein Cas2
MEAHGERLQYSVFVCDLTRTELVHARSAVEQEMDLVRDSVVIIDLGDVSSARFTLVGRRHPLPGHDPQIV